jgi:S1-C subfamily serine protease
MDHDVQPRRFPSLLIMLGLVVLGVFLGQFILNRIELNRMAHAQEPRQVAERGPLGEGERSVIDLFDRASPSVVYVTTIRRMRDRFTLDVTEVPAGTGSGFLWDDVGHVVTNFHVINQAGASFTVTLNDQTTYAATLVGIAPNNDLAVLKIDAPREKLKPVAVGRSNDLKVGQFVMAIGNPFGLDHSLTTGVVSALGRTIRSPSNFPIEDVIQTDAAINPGNSGGPLLDSSGRLIGVNTQIASPSGSSAGIGFAIPVDTVNRIVPSMIRNYTDGKLGMPSRAVLGVRLLPSQTNIEVTRKLGVAGVIIFDIDEKSAAAQSGLTGVIRTQNGGIEIGDVITEVAGRKVTDPSELMVALGRFDPGSTISIKAWKDGTVRDVEVKLGTAE